MNNDFVLLGLDTWNGSANQLISSFKNATGVTFPLLTNSSSVGSSYGVSHDNFILLDSMHKVNFTTTGGAGGNRQAVAEDLASRINTLLVTTGVDDRPNISDKFELFQNYPNPFNPETNIRFSLPAAAPVTLTVYSITGQEIWRSESQVMQAGLNSISWRGKNRDGLDVSAGVYLYSVRTDRAVKTGKMVLLR